MSIYFKAETKPIRWVLDQQHQSLIQYGRSQFEFPSTHYESYQENGTKYLKSLKPISDALQDELNACTGEIFLSGIPPEIPAESVADIAALIGEIYILRYKVTFSGNSRGFAYLQYINPTLMQLAIIRLPALFRQHSLPMIRVRQSRNSSKLLLKKTYCISPQNVFEMLRNLITFDKLIGREIFPGYFEYQIIFKCNEEAVHARRDLLRTISKFGKNAIVVWDTSSEETDFTKDCVRYESSVNAEKEYTTFVLAKGSCADVSNSILNQSPALVSKLDSLNFNQVDKRKDIVKNDDY